MLNCGIVQSTQVTTSLLSDLNNNVFEVEEFKKMKMKMRWISHHFGQCDGLEICSRTEKDLIQPADVDDSLPM